MVAEPVSVAFKGLVWTDRLGGLMPVLFLCCGRCELNETVYQYILSLLVSFVEKVKLTPPFNPKTDIISFSLFSYKISFKLLFHSPG